MPDIPHAIVNALGPLPALLLGLTVWLFIIGAPVLFVLAIRFLWYRHVYVGRSAELEKLIFQLHRIASALESQRSTSSIPEQEQAKAAPAPVVLSMFGR